MSHPLANDMAPKPKIEILPQAPRRPDPSAVDPFDDDRVREDLAEFSEASGVLEQYLHRTGVRFRKAGERAILRQWEDLYKSGERLIAARVAMERRKSEYLQLAREHEVKDTEKAAELAKLQADAEEHELRRHKAEHERQSVGRELPPEAQPAASEDEQKLRQACERRRLDARWDLHESLRPLQSLIELQRWRRLQRDQILKDRSLSPEEQAEDLQFVDDLYRQKHAELKVDTRIFEEQ
jgi:hypothetical protein